MSFPTAGSGVDLYQRSLRHRRRKMLWSLSKTSGEYMTLKRRESLIVLGSTAFIASLSPAARALSFEPKDKLKIGTKSQIDRFGIISFSYPGPTHPAQAVKLHDGRIVAYSLLCTHMGCPVSYDAETERYVCPCHQSAYAAWNDATVVQGPAPRPLPNILLEEDQDGNIFAVGISAPVFGSSTTIQQIDEIYAKESKL